jgi:hypothetical protein
MSRWRIVNETRSRYHLHVYSLTCADVTVELRPRQYGWHGIRAHCPGCCSNGFRRHAVCQSPTLINNVIGLRTVKTTHGYSAIKVRVTNKQLGLHSLITLFEFCCLHTKSPSNGSPLLRTVWCTNSSGLHIICFVVSGWCLIFNLEQCSSAWNDRKFQNSDILMSWFHAVDSPLLYTVTWSRKPIILP